MNSNVVVLSSQDIKSKRMPTARLPIEIEYWYVLPVLRRELAKSLKELGKLRQKEIAKILGISESAVSQYLKGTRATLDSDTGEEISFPNWLQQSIVASTKNILAKKDDTMTFLSEMNDLIQEIRSKPTSFLCKVHRAFGVVESDCTLCVKD